MIGRPQGFLRQLELSFNGDCFDHDPPSATLALREAFRAVSQRDGARRLRSLTVDLRDLRMFADPETALACVVLIVHFAELASVRLEKLEIITDTERFPAGAPFFTALPDLGKLVLVSHYYESGDGRLPDLFNQVAPPNAVPPYTARLKSLVLEGTLSFDRLIEKHDSSGPR